MHTDFNVPPPFILKRLLALSRQVHHRLHYKRCRHNTANVVFFIYFPPPAVLET
jgi:hypothetical protein